MANAKLIGDWTVAKQFLAAAPQKLGRAIDVSLQQEAELFRKNVVQGIKTQSPGGKKFKPLSPATLSRRKRRGFRGTKALIEGGDLRRSIKKVAGPGAPGERGFFVGVLRQARDSDGNSLVNIAATQELGATSVVPVSGGAVVVVVPPRPYMQPVADQLREGMPARVAERTKKILSVLG